MFRNEVLNSVIIVASKQRKHDRMLVNNKRHNPIYLSHIEDVFCPLLTKRIVDFMKKSFAKTKNNNNCVIERETLSLSHWRIVNSLS